MKLTFNNAALTKFLAALLTTFIVLIISLDLIIPVTPLKRLEQKFIDYRFKERGEIDFKDSAGVIILEITQDTYDQIPSPYNSWPWPRAYFARIIENLNEAGAKAIGIDLVMANPDKYSEENDKKLFEAIKKYQNVVVAGKINIEAEDAAEHLGSKTLIRNVDENFSSLFFDADSSIGIVQAVSDNDGVYRRYVPYVYSSVERKKIPSFAYALLNKYYNKPSFYTADKIDNGFIYNDVEIPIYEESTVLINYYGPDGTFPRVKLIDVLDDSSFTTVDERDFETPINTWDNPDYGLKHSGLFKDKIVLIGSTMPEDKDIVPVSFSPGIREGDNLIYGVEYHANAVQNFLDRNFLKPFSSSVTTLFLIIITFGMFYITSFSKRIKIKHSSIIEIAVAALVLLLIFALFRISIFLFESENLVIPVVYPSLSIIFGYVGSTVFEFIAERKKSAMVKAMFSQYVSTSLVNELIANPDKLKLGGEEKTLTILFSDIAGFTSFSEGKTPEEVVTFINQFLDEMSESVLEFNGTLDKYLGDSVMAFWGAPVEIPDHAELACKCALDMKTRLEKLNEKWNTGDAAVKMRIGINTGDVVVGNIGGKKRFDYTVMGDNVNLASRLEGANKIYHTSIMISESTYNKIKSKFFTRELDTIKVKGKKNITRVYELVGFKLNDMDSVFKEFTEGIKLYKEGKFNDSIIHFENEVKNSGDEVSKVYINRCKEYISNPPLNWSGITILTEK